MCGVVLRESEQNNAKTAKSNPSERTCYQDRIHTVLQRRAEAHDNHTYPQYIKNALEAVKSYTYSGSHIYIIGGYDREYGNDENEVIIREAEIVGIIE